MYDCLPMYHTVGGVVATGALLVRGGSVVIREKFSAQRILGRRRQMGLHAVPVYRRTVPLSRQRAAASARARASAAALLRQRAARRRLGEIPAALRHSENSGILCGDRRQCLALQCRRQGRRHRPHAAVPGAPLSAGAGEIRRHHGRAAARRRAASASAARPARAARRSAAFAAARRPDPAAIRGLYQRRGYRAQDPARRVRAGRCLVSHRRSDAHGRRRLLLFRRPHRRHVPLEGRERRDVRSRRRDHGVSGHRAKRPFMALRFPEPKAPPAWPRSSPTAIWISRSCASISRTGCRLTPGRSSCASRNDIDVTGTFKHKKSDLVRQGFDPRAMQDAIYFDDPRKQAYVPLDPALHARITSGDLRL